MLFAMVAPLILVCGCASHRERVAFVYKEPLNIEFVGLQPTNNSYVAFFIATNSSDSLVRIEQAGAGVPVHSLEWKGHYYGLPMKLNEDTCTSGGLTFKLAPRNSYSFSVFVPRRGEPFRVGIWAWTSFSESIPQDVFWSDYVSQ